MKPDVSELHFATRAEFRKWLSKNAETSDGVWLVFGKQKTRVTLSSNDALEEALRFGWIDGQMKRIDETKYLKYFARRRDKSPWSEKNKNAIDDLRKRNLLTPLGEKAVENAKRNGMWDNSPTGPVTDEQIAAFEEKLKEHDAAFRNYLKLSRSAQVVFVKRHRSFKGEEARMRDFVKIVDVLANK